MEYCRNEGLQLVTTFKLKQKMSQYLPPEVVIKVLSFINEPPTGEAWWQAWYGNTQEEEYYHVLDLFRKEYIKMNGDIFADSDAAFLGKRRSWLGKRRVVSRDFDDEDLDDVIDATHAMIIKVRRHMQCLEQIMRGLWELPEDMPLIIKIEMKQKVEDVYKMVNGFRYTIPMLMKLK